MILILLALGALMSLPALLTGHQFEGAGEIASFAAGVAVLAITLASLQQITLHYRWLVPAFWALTLTSFTIRLTWFLVQDFAAQGFTDNFFAHISWAALRVGMQEYAGLLIVAGLAFGAIAYAILHLGRRVIPVRPVPAVFGVGAGMFAIALAPINLPETALVTSYARIQATQNLGALESAELQKLRRSELVTLHDNSKAAIGGARSGPTGGRNLILVYLESFHLAFTDEGPYKDLTPNINRLKREHGYHPAWLSSGDVTIDGLISTLCGTLVSTPQGSSTFANRQSILPRLACLPDVLEAAGYYQIYLGGFDKSFSGKSVFLREHGYDTVLGWSDWRELGFKKRDDYWGLSDDELLVQALKRIERLSDDADRRPYNVTLLTLGTHPPGFFASSCPEYRKGGKSYRMLNAIHCTDHLVGRFVRNLKQNGLLSETTLVITGDHDSFNIPNVLDHFPGLASDPRLLYMTIGSDRPKPASDAINVGYDLAPSALEALGVTHDVKFIWGQSISDPRDYHVTREFRGSDFDQLQSLSGHPGNCDGRDLTLDVPLNDCEHREIVRLSDRYMYRFAARKRVDSLLCTTKQPLVVTVPAGDGRISIKYRGSEVADAFADRGRPLEPTKPGFYLFIKGSKQRPSAHYYYRMDHINWQIRLLEQLLGLDPRDQFVLAFKPPSANEPIEPLEAMLEDYGFEDVALSKPFALATRGAPGADQVLRDRGQEGASLSLGAAECRALAAARSGESVVARTVIVELLAPYLEDRIEL